MIISRNNLLISREQWGRVNGPSIRSAVNLSYPPEITDIKDRIKNIIIKFSDDMTKRTNGAIIFGTLFSLKAQNFNEVNKLEKVQLSLYNKFIGIVLETYSNEFEVTHEWYEVNFQLQDLLNKLKMKCPAVDVNDYRLIPQIVNATLKIDDQSNMIFKLNDNQKVVLYQEKVQLIEGQ